MKYYRTIVYCDILAKDEYEAKRIAQDYANNTQFRIVDMAELATQAEVEKWAELLKALWKLDMPMEHNITMIRAALQYKLYTQEEFDLVYIQIEKTALMSD